MRVPLASSSPRPQPHRPLFPALTSGSRSPCRPEAEPQPREPPTRPSGASSCGGCSPHAPRPASEYGSSSTPGSRTASQEPSEWIPVVFSEWVCSPAAPYSSRAGLSEPPLAGHLEEKRAPIASHSWATAASTAAAGDVSCPHRDDHSEPAAAGSGTTEHRTRSASLMRPPRPPGLLLSELQPMSRAGAGQRAGRRRRASPGGRLRWALGRLRVTPGFCTLLKLLGVREDRSESGAGLPNTSTRVKMWAKPAGLLEANPA